MPNFVKVVLVKLPDKARKVAVFEVFGQDMFRKLLVLVVSQLQHLSFCALLLPLALQSYRLRCPILLRSRPEGFPAFCETVLASAKAHQGGRHTCRVFAPTKSQLNALLMRDTVSWDSQNRSSYWPLGPPNCCPCWAHCSRATLLRICSVSESDPQGLVAVAHSVGCRQSNAQCSYVMDVLPPSGEQTLYSKARRFSRLPQCQR